MARIDKCGAETTRGLACALPKSTCPHPQHWSADDPRRRSLVAAEPAVPARREVRIAAASGFAVRSGVYQVPGADPNPDIREQYGFGTPSGDAGIYWDLYTSVPVAQLVFRLISAVLTSQPADFRYERQAEGDPEILDRTRRAFFDDLQFWDRYLAQATMSLIFGFMPFEVEVGRARDGAHVPRRFLQRMPWSVWKIRRETERLAGITQRAQVEDGGPLRELDIPASRLLWHVHDQAADHLTGMSVLRSAYGPLSNIRNLWRFAMMAAQRTAVPALIAFLEKQDYESIETKDDVFAFLEGLRAAHNSSAVLPSGAEGKGKIDKLGGDFNADGLIQLERAMAWNVLSVCGGQFLALGTTDTGSRAVGDVHSRVFYFTMDAKARELCLPINDTSDFAPLGSVRWFVDSNFGPQDVYPTLYIPTPRADTVRELAEALGILVDKKLLTPTLPDQSRLRELFNLPQLDQATADAVEEHIYRIGGTDPEIFGYDQENGIPYIDEIRERKGLGPDRDPARGAMTVPQYKALVEAQRAGSASQSMGAQ